MKRNLTAVLMFVLMASVAHAATPPFFKDNGDSKYQLDINDLTMVIDAAQGGKVLSFKYKDKEMISQSKWRETFGSTFWTSPQKEWNWPPVPEYDKMPYTVESSDEKLTMTSQVNEKLKYRIRKEFTFDQKDNAVVVTYSIINEANETRQVAPWEITRVPNDGIIFFDAPVEKITPKGLMNFANQYGAAWYQTDETNENRKINADGKGWLAYINQGLLLVKKFLDLNEGQPAPEEAEIQVYVNRGKTYIELESQGAYTTLKPNESLSWTVRWYLLPYDGAMQPNKKLVKKVKKLVK